MNWKPVYGFRFPHRVSDMGILQRQKSDGSWRDVKVRITSKRAEVYMTKPDGSCSTVTLARVVYEAFRGPIPTTHNVIHKNGMKSDCSIYNLVAIDRRTAVSRPGNSRPVMKVDKRGNVVAIYSSTVEAARENHISQAAIAKRCVGKVRNPYRLDGYNYVYEQKPTRWG